MTGAVIGEYRLGPLLAFGRHARIFAAEDAQGRPVLLKMLRPGVRRHHAFRELLTRERRLLERLDHPNIERFRGRGEFHGEPYYAVEMVAGVSLRDVAEDRAFNPWTTANVVELAVALFDALAHAHALGVEHGAIDDDAVRIAPAGRVVLTGFGIAPLRCDSRRESDQRTQFEPRRIDPVPKDRQANDVAAAARLVLARLDDPSAPRALRGCLREAIENRVEERPTAHDLAAVFRGVSASPVPVGFDGAMMWDETEEMPKRKLLWPRPPSVTLLMAETEALAVEPPTERRVPIAASPKKARRGQGFFGEAMFAAAFLGVVLAGAWVAG